jgi:hypothetical protein
MRLLANARTVPPMPPRWTDEGKRPPRFAPPRKIRAATVFPITGPRPRSHLARHQHLPGDLSRPKRSSCAGGSHSARPVAHNGAGFLRSISRTPASIMYGVLAGNWCRIGAVYPCLRGISGNKEMTRRVLTGKSWPGGLYPRGLAQWKNAQAPINPRFQFSPTKPVISQLARPLLAPGVRTRPASRPPAVRY